MALPAIDASKLFAKGGLPPAPGPHFPYAESNVARTVVARSPRE